MKKEIILLILSFLIMTNHFNCFSQTVSISGKVTDFEGNPINSCFIDLKHADFTSAYSTYSDKNGNYKLENVEKGNYLALFALRMDEYPTAKQVPEADMRLEFWAWNIIADSDLVINPRYHKLELYGTVATKMPNGYMLYFRPMSLTNFLVNENVSVAPENLKVNVFADEEPLKIKSIQPVEEYNEEMIITGYIIQVDKPKITTDKPFIIFRVEAENIKDAEKGENLYFFEVKNYK